MTNAEWSEEAFFAEPEPLSVDGGTTNRGLLWHEAPPRWGHSMHAMCSYQGMFPAKLVRYFLSRFTSPGDLVADPFCGRGTTVLQGRVDAREVVACDLNPLAYVLSRAKARPPTWAAFDRYLGDLARRCRGTARSGIDVPDEIAMLFHSSTLDQLTFLRSHLLERPRDRWSDEDFMLAGCVAGVLHGGTRSDGSSAYLSISMPNTFSMSPNYVRRYIAEHSLVPPDQDVFACVRSKAARLYLDGTDGPDATVHFTDANEFLRRSDIAGRVNLIVTSPPYLRVVNYATANWIRLWWLGISDVSTNAGAGRRSLDTDLDHRHNYHDYREFLSRVLDGISSALAPTGVAAIVIGDVASPEAETIPLAQRVWSDLAATCDLELVDFIEDALPAQYKVSRIWGETRGRATDRDCVLLLKRSGRALRRVDPCDWTEAYKSAGPDAAHRAARGG
jgi:hypothetical protein